LFPCAEIENKSLLVQRIKESPKPLSLPFLLLVLPPNTVAASQVHQNRQSFCSFHKNTAFPTRELKKKKKDLLNTCNTIPASKVAKSGSSSSYQPKIQGLQDEKITNDEKKFLFPYNRYLNGSSPICLTAPVTSR
jgi:hypothetical protein